MSANPPSPPPSGISSAAAEPTASSDGHSASSSSGIPIDVANSEQNMEVQKATSSLCCIPINPGASPAATTTTAAAAATTAPALPGCNDNGRHHTLQLLDKIGKDIVHVKKAYADLTDYGSGVSKQIKEASKRFKSLDDLVKQSSDRPEEGPMETYLQEDLIELKKKVMKLKQQIPSKPKARSTSEADPHRPNDSSHGDSGMRHIASKILDKLPNLCKNEMLVRSSEFKDFEALYNGLDDKQKVCLLCFSAFPEKEIIKKRFMFYWWTGEGFVAPVKDSEQTAEELANEVFSELMAKGFIEPFSEKRTLDCLVNKCRVNPFVRAALIALARRAKLFDFDAEGKPTCNFSSSCRACLLAGEKLKGEGMENVHMLFNVDQAILDFEKPELFSLMKNINLLCLGRWQTSPRHHIEVEDTKFLEGLKNMKHLKFLSLQGISQIMDIPSSVSNLTNLTILDIRACPNLEKIPGEIGLLRSLTRLDMSECYLLVNMPKEISTLLELEVLKGFVVGNLEGKEKDTCTLEDLADLPKLRKLRIFTGRKDFPKDSELRNLNRFEKLLTLTIEWGGDSQGKSKNNPTAQKISEITQAVQPAEQQNSGGAETQNPANGVNIRENDDADHEADSTATPSSMTRCNWLALDVPTNCFRKTTTSETNTDASPELPTQLEKLDLQCFPHVEAPNWLMDDKVNKLKKLYIRGGTLRDVGQYGQYGVRAKKKWTVEILRLKFLNNLEMDWRELLELFPKLMYLEKVRCPKLTLFPCDEQGVWMKKPAKLK